MSIFSKIFSKKSSQELNTCDISAEKYNKLDALYSDILLSNNYFQDLNQFDNFEKINKKFVNLEDTLLLNNSILKRDGVNLNYFDFRKFIIFNLKKVMTEDKMILSNLMQFINELRIKIENSPSSKTNNEYFNSRELFVESNKNNIFAFSYEYATSFKNNLLLPEFTILNNLKLFTSSYELDINDFTYNNLKSKSNLISGTMSLLDEEYKLSITKKIDNSKFYFSNLYLLDVRDEFEIKTNPLDEEGMFETKHYKYNPVNELYFKDDCLHKFNNMFYTQSIIMLIAKMAKEDNNFNFIINQASYDKLIFCAKYYFNANEVGNYEKIFSKLVRNSAEWTLTF